jgi:hypothetical protein
MNILVIIVAGILGLGLMQTPLWPLTFIAVPLLIRHYWR